MGKIKKIKFNGFGFPIELKNVPTIEVRGSVEPHINYKTLAKKVVAELCSIENHSSLTGRQVFFLRQQLQMTTREFGSFMGATHAAVVKWEKRGDLSTLMNKANEILLRLKVLNYLGVKPAICLEVLNLVIEANDHNHASHPLRIAL